MDADFNFLSTEGDSEVVKRNCRKIISILGAHKVALWFYDVNTNSIGFSDDFFKNLGLEEVGIQYDTYEGFIHSVHPNDVVNYLNAFHSIMSGAEQMLKVRFRTIGKNEQTLWLEDSLFTCLECKDASAPRIIGYRTNITNRVEEEDKFEYLKEYSKKIIDALPEFIFIFDDKYYIVDVIIPLKTKLFHTREELIGQPLRRFFEPEISDLYERTIRECLATDEIVEVESSMEFNGVRFYSQAKVSSFGANQVIWVVRDITDKVKHIEALELMRKRADEAERLKRAFLASMSHELRTPLNAIVGFSEVLATNDLSPEERRNYANVMQANADLFLKLVNDIIDFSLFDSCDIELNKERVELTGLILDLYNQYVDRMKPEVKLIVGHPNYPIWVETDGNRIMQVVDNFITNAIKNTERGSIIVNVIRLNEWVKISVSDTGKGIPHDMIDRIFEIFEKIDEFSQGTGLGLSISKQIAQRLGGYIQTESVLGKGSTFSLYIPYYAVDVDECMANGVASPQLNNGKKIILVVDDSMSVFNRLYELIGDNFRVLWARSSNEAFKRIQKQMPHLILMSMDLQEQSGVNGVAKIRSLDAHVPIIGVFERTEYNRFKEALAAGCNEVMAKPYSLVRLNSIFSRLL